MMAELFFDDREVSYQSFKFAGGEMQVRIAHVDAPTDRVKIVCRTRSSDDLMELFLLTDAVRHAHGDDTPIDLVLPYLPYARQDRVCYPGEAFSLNVMLALLMTMDYRHVEFWDVHNPRAIPTDFICWTNKPAADFVKSIDLPRPIIVAPDKGAVDRAVQCAAAIGSNFVLAEKVRDPKDGEITGMEIVLRDAIVRGDHDFLIVDDICDGGRTFIELAKILRPLTTGKIYLYVTHGIFSAGFDTLHTHLDGIYTANAFRLPDAHSLKNFITILEG
jgi:ribose-phosphate pyrophosphokinase